MGMTGLTVSHTYFVASPFATVNETLRAGYFGIKIVDVSLVDERRSVVRQNMRDYGWWADVVAKSPCPQPMTLKPTPTSKLNPPRPFCRRAPLGTAVIFKTQTHQLISGTYCEGHHLSGHTARCRWCHSDASSSLIIEYVNVLFRLDWCSEMDQQTIDYL